MFAVTATTFAGLDGRKLVTFALALALSKLNPLLALYLPMHTTVVFAEIIMVLSIPAIVTF